MTINFLRVLEDDLAGNPVLVAGTPLASDISQIEAFAGFPLPADYRAFVEKYGAAIVGPYSVYGVGASEAMGKNESSVIAVTERFRADGWPGAEGTLVVSMDHSGNAITLDAQGIVHRFDHDSGTSEMLAPSFGNFVIWCMANEA
jgi:hypothetical protein